MHNAPSVTYPVGRFFLLTGLWTALGSLSAVLLVSWTVAIGRFGPAQLFMLLLWSVAAGVAVWCWQRPEQGHLQWDGVAWAWHGAGPVRPGQLSVRLDWQHVLLLAFVSETGRTHWLWLARSTDARRWLAVRRALYGAPQRQRMATDDGALVP